MKRKLLYSLAIYAATVTLIVQNTNAQSWDLGGNIVTKDTALGTINAFALKMITKNIERMRISSIGRVGIGTKIPESLLSVFKTNPGSATADFRNTGVGPNISWIHFGPKGDWYIRSASSNGNVIIQDQSPYGKVGIGTSTPASFFSVVETIAGTATAEFSNSGIGPNISYVHYGSAGDWYIRSAANNGNVIIQDLSPDSKVGIGTYTPFRKLEVKDGDIRIKTTHTPRYLEFVDDAPDHTDYRFEHRNLVYPETEFPNSFLQVQCSSDDFNSHIDLAKFVAPGGGQTLRVFGRVGATAYDVFSDARLKKEVSNLGSGLEIIKKLLPKTYLFKKEEYARLNLPVQKQFGFLAQDIETILPELVTTSREQVETDAKGKSRSEDLKAVNYIELIPILTKAIQEQQEQIEELKKMINNLSRSGKIDSTTSGNTKFSQILSHAKIEQNKPNPFTNSTSIPYSFPKETKNAQMIITDVMGKVIKLIQLPKTNHGTVNINASTLGSGTYNYSLLIDGATTETRKMIVSK
ncbi:MAG: tail fiber domain-containing protein [Ferruginibacter sp.]